MSICKKFAAGMAVTGLLSLGITLPASAQPGKPGIAPSPDVLPNIITDCYVPLKKMLNDGTVSPDQSLASTGLPACQVAGADKAKVGQFVEEFFVPRQIGVSP